MPDLFDPQLARQLFSRLMSDPNKGQAGPIQDSPGSKPSTWQSNPAGYTFESGMDFLKGLLIGEDEKPGQNWRNGGALLGAAMPVIGGVKGGLIKAAGEEGPGLYSRLEKVFLGQGKMHPNKAASLAKSGASAEEAQLRKLPELLKAKGDAPVTGAEITEHLQKNPINLSKKTLSDGKGKWYHVRDANGELHSTDDFNLANRWANEFGDGSMTVGAAPDRTQYSGYKIPGGENYKENLIHYHSPEQKRIKEIYARRNELDRLTGVNPEADAEYNLLGEELDKLKDTSTYTSGHFNEDGKNLLAHSRTTDRFLVPPPEPTSLQKSREALNKLEGTVWDTADQRGLLKDIIRREEMELPPHSKGRFIEELQSDWHQAGREHGYRTPEMESKIAELKATQNNLYKEKMQLAAESLKQDNAIWELMSQGFAETSPDIKAIREAAKQTTLRYEQAEKDLEDLSNKLYDARQVVPDAPFKESWPDLLLKQQILDVAKNPELEWIGTSTAQPHIDRYGSERVSWAPNLEQPTIHAINKRRKEIDDAMKALANPDGAFTRETADEYVKLANEDDALLEQLKQARQKEEAPAPTGKFQVLFEPQVGGRGQGIEDLGAEALRRRLIENSSHIVDNPEQLKDVVYDHGVNPEKVWKKIQATPEGGEYLPRAEGMKTFYDQMVPNKLEKLLKPFGGKVELQDVAGIPATEGLSVQLKPHTFQAWVARLTPEMKQRILKEGLPLLTALYFAYSKEQGNAGTEEQ